jgi:exosortase/archaeosortase family protein
MSTRFNRYKVAPTHKSKMPGSTDIQDKNNPSYKIILYSAAVVAIILIVYYLPNYFFLEKATADHATYLLGYLGINVQTNVIGESVFLANIGIVRDCTGVQVIAVFLGLLLPLPMTPWKKKLITLAIVSASIYAANVLRIALEFWLVYYNILPWSLAHYPLSLLLGIIGVAVLVIATDRLLPEFGNFLLQATRFRHA